MIQCSYDQISIQKGYIAHLEIALSLGYTYINTYMYCGIGITMYMYMAYSLIPRFYLGMRLHGLTYMYPLHECEQWRIQGPGGLGSPF